MRNIFLLFLVLPQKSFVLVVSAGWGRGRKVERITERNIGADLRGFVKETSSRVEASTILFFDSRFYSA